MKPWAEKFYNSEAWHLCRDSFLSSKNYLCERCSTASNPVPAKIAHHKIYLTHENINNPNISLSHDNLEALCQECHNREHHKAEKQTRYFVDETGNIYPPHSETALGGQNTEGGK